MRITLTECTVMTCMQRGYVSRIGHPRALGKQGAAESAVRVSLVLQSCLLRC